MAFDKMTMAAMAEIGAIRNVFVHAVALKLLEDPDPVRTLSMIDRHLTAAPTEPTDSGGALDPAMSDMLAAMTDDRTQALIEDVNKRLAAFLGAPV